MGLTWQAEQSMDQKFQNELDPADVCGAARAHDARAASLYL
jgi:hypothetical protein